jgi:hypothetical protein
VDPSTFSADPLTNRTFGIALSRVHAEAGGTEFMAAVVCEQTATAQLWEEQAVALLRSAANATAPQASTAAHERWWCEFWNRSYVQLHYSTNASVGATAARITRQAALDRFMLAAQGRAGIVKFNGGLFNTEPPPCPTNLKRCPPACVCGRDGSAGADCREWGGATWLQNTRHMYWPGLRIGLAQLMGLASLGLARDRHFMIVISYIAFSYSTRFWG